MPNESLDLAASEDSLSVDDFIKELEEKEKDLMIQADMEIEVEISSEQSEDGACSSSGNSVC